MQGKENDIVIISLVRTNNIGFNDNRHRINVLLTRAKKSLLIVGNLSNYQKNDETWKNLVLNAKSRKLFDTVDYLRKKK